MDKTLSKATAIAPTAIVTYAVVQQARGKSVPAWVLWAAAFSSLFSLYKAWKAIEAGA